MTNRRSFYLFDILVSHGEKVSEFSETMTYQGDCAFVFSPARTVNAKLLDKLPRGSTVFYTKGEEEYPFNDISLVNLLRQEKYCRINSRLTAEGALALTISSTERALLYSSVLLLGYGRLGKAVAEMFYPVCRNLSVATFTLPETIDAGKKYQTYLKREFAAHLNEYDVIINTVPANILNAEDAEKIKPDALYLELASAPYGLCPTLGGKLKAKYVLGSALPDKYCPASAGDALYDCIRSVLSSEVEK